jgi:hypothetical protein
MLDQYFDIVDYDPNTQYRATEYTVMASIYESGKSGWFDSLIQDGAKLMYDCFWEHHFSDQLRAQYPNAHLACCKYYFWILEYYVTSIEKYNNYTPCKNYTHLALMPIRRLKTHRQQLLTALDPWLENMIYSIVYQDILLPNDLDASEELFQRYFNPDWYNNTYFSIVAESVIYTKSPPWLPPDPGSLEAFIARSSNLPPFVRPRYNLHVTEKTFKPLAFYHPFVVFGQTGTLAYLHELGFETFENLFDESYDTVEDHSTRLAQIVNNVSNFKQQDYNELTWQKLNHNHDLFYNRTRVEQMFVDGIINPILEYAQTR